MRDMFRGYYQPTNEETENIWRSGRISLDANVLLSLYKVLPTTSDLYLNALESRSDQMWLPHQVALEFHRNVHSERARQTAAHRDRIRSIDGFLEELRKTAKKSRLQVSTFQEAAEKSLREFKEHLDSEMLDITNQTHHQTPDDLLQRIAALFENRVGDPFSEEQLAKIHEEGTKRYAESIPPGYEDAKTKSGGQEYGDLVAWKQLLEAAAQFKSDFIFVTDDDKEDWWLKFDKKSIAPRPELIQEFRAETGQELLILNSSQFYHVLLPENGDGNSKNREVLAARKDMQVAVAESQTRETEMKRRLLLDLAAGKRAWPASEALPDKTAAQDREAYFGQFARHPGEDAGLPTRKPDSHRRRIRHLMRLLNELREIEVSILSELDGDDGYGGGLEHHQEAHLRIRLAEIRDQIDTIQLEIRRLMRDEDEN